METIVIHTNFTNTVKREIRAHPRRPARAAQDWSTLRAVFDDPERLRAERPPKRSRGRSRPSSPGSPTLLRPRGVDPHAAAHFLIRLLFCLFAEDIGLLPDELFAPAGRERANDPAAFEAPARPALRRHGDGRLVRRRPIPHFDGGLFDDDTVLDLESDGPRDPGRGDAAGLVGHRAVDPRHAVRAQPGPGKRAQLGAHYTSREDILLIVEPVLMAPLRRRWQEVQGEGARSAAEKHGAAKSGQATRASAETSRTCSPASPMSWPATVLDPACGSGNFLYVALRELLDLEKEVITLAADLGVGAFFPSASPEPAPRHRDQPYAHELAQATIWIGYIQWLRENGFGLPTEPILKPLDNIHADGRHPRLRRSRATPSSPSGRRRRDHRQPAVPGGKRMRSELGDQLRGRPVRPLRRPRPRESDLCCYWFEKARAMIERGRLKRAGLLATQGIRGGANRRVLERIKETGDIFWAQSDRTGSSTAPPSTSRWSASTTGQRRTRSWMEKHVRRSTPT